MNERQANTPIPKRTQLIAIAAGALALLLIAPSLILPRLRPQPDDPSDPTLTPTPAPFTFIALQISDDLLYALDTSLAGLVNYTLAPGLEPQAAHTLIQLSYDGRVIESDPPAIHITTLEPLSTEDFPTLTPEQLLTLLDTLPQSALVDARPATSATTLSLPNIGALPRPSYHLAHGTANDPYLPNPDPDSLLLVYGSTDAEAKQATQALKQRGYSAYSLGSLERFTTAFPLTQRPASFPHPLKQVSDWPPTGPIHDEDDPGIDRHFAHFQIWVTPDTSQLDQQRLSLQADTLRQEQLHFAFPYDLYIQAQDGWTWLQPLTYHEEAELASLRDFDLRSDYGPLSAGRYKLVYRIDSATDRYTVNSIEFDLDPQAIRDHAYAQEPRLQNRPSAADLGIQLQPWQVERGGIWLTYDNTDAAQTATLSAEPLELARQTDAGWQHLASFTDPQIAHTEIVKRTHPDAVAGLPSPLKAYVTDGFPLGIHWEPILGPLAPGDYQLTLPLHFATLSASFSLTVEFTITTDTPQSATAFHANLPTTQQWFDDLATQEEIEWTLTLDELTHTALHYRVTNHTDQLRVASQHPLLLQRQTQANPSNTTDLYDPTAWRILPTFTKTTQSPISPAGQLAQDPTQYEVYGFQPNEPQHLTLPLNTALNQLEPGLYLLVVPVVHRSVDTEIPHLVLTTLFAITDD